jgi:hypothetical protein
MAGGELHGIRSNSMTTLVIVTIVLAIFATEIGVGILMGR